jgi:hypothetical protein
MQNDFILGSCLLFLLLFRAFPADTAQALGAGPVSLPAGRQALPSLTQLSELEFEELKNLWNERSAKLPPRVIANAVWQSRTMQGGYLSGY